MEFVEVVNGHNFWLGIPIILVIIGISLCVLMISWIVKCKPRNKEEKDYVVDAFNSLWAIGEWNGEDDLYGSFEDCFEWATKGQLV